MRIPHSAERRDSFEQKERASKKVRDILPHIYELSECIVIDHSTRVLLAWHGESRSRHEGVHVSTLRSALIRPAIEQGDATEKKKIL